MSEVDYGNENGGQKNGFFISRYESPIRRLYENKEISEELREDAVEWLRGVVFPYHKDTALIYAQEGVLNLLWYAPELGIRFDVTMSLEVNGSLCVDLSVSSVSEHRDDVPILAGEFSDNQESAQQVFRRFIAAPYQKFEKNPQYAN